MSGRRQTRRALLAGLSVAVAGCGDDTVTSTAPTSPPTVPSTTDDGERLSTDRWPMHGVDAGNTGVHPSANGPPPTAQQRWRYRDERASNPSLAVGEGWVYLSGMGVHAVDARTGVREWQWDPDGNVFTDAPALADGRVLVGTNDGRVIALDRASGEVVWETDVGLSVYEPVRVVDGVAYVPADGSLVAIDGDGSIRWNVETPGRPTATAVTGDGVFVGTESGGLLALGADGTERWRALDGHVSEPAVVDGVVFVGDRDGVLYALDAADGDVAWEFAADDAVRAPAVGDGTVYAPSHDQHVYALDAADGTERWRTDVGGNVYAKPAVADGGVYVGQHHGALVALDAADGTEHWRTMTRGTIAGTPAVAGGHVYAASTWLYAFAAPRTVPEG